MNPTISSISYCPVKSVSFQNIQLCEIKKNLGIINDRIFAFSRNVDSEKAKLIEKDANERKLSYFLTLTTSSPAFSLAIFFTAISLLISKFFFVLNLLLSAFIQ